MGEKTALEVIEEKSVGSYDLDREVWSALAGHGNPVPHYAEEWFQDARSDGDARASATTSIGKAMSLLVMDHPDARFNTEHKGDSFTVRAGLTVDGENLCHELTVPMSEFLEARAALAITRCALHLAEMAYDLRYGPGTSPDGPS